MYKKRIVFLLTALVLSACAWAQTWEEVRNSEEYLTGEGWGKTVEEAEKNALAALIGKIATSVSSQSHSTLEAGNNNGTLGETSHFMQTVNTYSQATLTNTEQRILQREPEAYVVRWIKKAEINKIFEMRKWRVLDLVKSAERAEEKGMADNVLRYYFWSLSLLKSLQYPNDVMYTDRSGEKHVLANWIKERMDETFSQLAVRAESTDEGQTRLFFTYKGKPVNSLGYTYWDGQGWSALCSARDGWGDVELMPGFASSQLQVRFEYEFRGEAVSDPEVQSVLNALGETPMRKATTNVPFSLKRNKKQEKESAQLADSTFTTNSAEVLKAPTPMGKEAAAYTKLLEEVVAAVKMKNYTAVRHLFTDNGWDMFRKLMEYGRSKVLNSNNIRFYDNNGIVTERGLMMSFSFASGVQKSFVEDVVLTFDRERKIDNIAFGLGKTAEDDILNKGVWDERSRFAIMNFLENYKTAYALKRLDYISSVFDDDAVIITGTVIRKAASNVNLENQSRISSDGNQIIRRNRQTKDQYLQNLKRCFQKNEFVNIRFSNNDILKLGASAGESYGIQIAQDYYSSTYGDKGYLMLMVDINDPQHPLIKVRTWQPEKDPNFGLYEPGDF